MIVIPAPIFIGINSSRNPVISDNYENTGHRFSPVRRLFAKPQETESRHAPSPFPLWSGLIASPPFGDR
jgi:hypothetical protein